MSAWMANLLLMCQATDVVRIVVAGLNFFLDEYSIIITHCLKKKALSVAASITGFDAKKLVQNSVNAIFFLVLIIALCHCQV